MSPLLKTNFSFQKLPYKSLSVLFCINNYQSLLEIVENNYLCLYSVLPVDLQHLFKAIFI